MAGKNKRKSRTSSGMKHVNRASYLLKRTLMKIARWERNRENPEKKSSWAANQHPRIRNRHNNWDTSGLLKTVAVLENVIAKGKRTRI